MPDGDQGFPGNMTANCVYRFLEPATLRVELTATADKATIVNLTQHAYFNLDGSPDILDHELHARLRLLHAGRRRTDPDRRDPRVEGTPFDFRRPRAIRNPAGQTYDINFVVTSEPATRRTRLDRDAEIAEERLSLELHSTEPGVQIYDAAKLELPGSRARRRAATAPTPAWPWSRRRSPIRPIAGISAPACCGPTRNIATSANSASPVAEAADLGSRGRLQPRSLTSAVESATSPTAQQRGCNRITPCRGFRPGRLRRTRRRPRGRDRPSRSSRAP